MTHLTVFRIMLVVALSVAFPTSPLAKMSAVSAAHAEAPAVAMGQPGLSFRYVQTFGVTEQAYQADTQHLNSPSGLYIDSSNQIYITEDRGSRVLKYDQVGNSLQTVGTAGLHLTEDYVFDSPHDVATDSAGNLWVADGNRVVEYSPVGTFLRTIPPNNSWESGNDSLHFNGANGIGFDLAGHLFVSDQGNHRVQVYTFSGGRPVYSTTIGVGGVSGNDDVHFNQPLKIALDQSGRLFVVDNGNGRVQRCGFSDTWTCATLDSGMNSPQGVYVDGANNVYISDAGNYRIRKCNSGGACTTLISGISGWTTDIAVDSGGALYMAKIPSSDTYVPDSSFNVVHKYNSSGSLLGVFKGVPGIPYVAANARLYQPWGVAVAADGGIYIGEDQGYRLVKFSPNGTQQWAVGQAGVWGNDNTHFGVWWAGIQGNMMLDRAGHIMVPDIGDSLIKVFSSNGTFLYTFGSGWGQGSDQFSCLSGIAVSPINGDVVVADRCNQRVQIYTADFSYKATLGITGTSGSDDAHFKQPWGVAVDSNGNIYVADSDNNRVQKCSLGLIGSTCTTFIGFSGTEGSDMSHLAYPRSVAVDGARRVYVADSGNQRVQVFDAAGMYLTTIGGIWGGRSGELRNPSGVAVDGAGNVYVTDATNHRVQKFAPGVPGWVQRNVNGMGNNLNQGVSTLAVFAGKLYAGTSNWQDGAQLWQSIDGRTWVTVTTPGFGGGTTNPILMDTLVFKNQLYAATGENGGSYIGRLWRSSNGTTWNPVGDPGFGDSTNNGIADLAIFSDTLYAVTVDESTGFQIWRSSTGNALDWTRVVSDGLGGGNGHVGSSTGLIAFNGYLYVGLEDYTTGAQIWRSNDGEHWSLVSGDGNANSNNSQIGGKGVFNGYLYMGYRNNVTGAQIWRTANGTTWEQVMSDGFGSWRNSKVETLVVVGGTLLAISYNDDVGMTVWRSTNGTTWSPAALAGFGDSNNLTTHWVNGNTSFNGSFYIGTWNSANGGELWQYLDRTVFLPIVRR